MDEEAIKLVPEAVIEVISKGYEAKDIEIGPQFSPDGRKIAFESSRSGAYEIWTCQSDGSGLTQISQSSPFVPRLHSKRFRAAPRRIPDSTSWITIGDLPPQSLPIQQLTS